MDRVGDGQNERRDRGGRRILIAGTGGQGVLTAARLLCDVCVECGHHVVSGQLHGMAQRGGSVQSTVLIDAGISPVIPGGGADVVLGFEPVETVRALPWMSARTAVFMNTAPVIPFVLGQRFALKQSHSAYPEAGRLTDAIGAVAPHLLTLDATKAAAEAGSAKALNMVMLGCLLGAGLLACTPDEFWRIAVGMMPPKLAAANTRAFESGAEVGRHRQPTEVEA